MRASKIVAVIGVSFVAVVFGNHGGAAPALRPAPPADGPTIISVSANGEIIPDGVMPLSKPEDLMVFLEAELIRQKAAAARQKVKSEPSVAIRAERQAKFAKVHEVISVAKQVGFQNISLETK